MLKRIIPADMQGLDVGRDELFFALELLADQCFHLFGIDIEKRG